LALSSTLTLFSSSSSSSLSFTLVDANAQTVPKHTTSLTLSIPSNVPWGNTVTVTGKLVDTSAGNVGLGARTITFSTTNGSPLPPTINTKTDGTYSSTILLALLLVAIIH
jgi:hypothetical protein